MVAEQLTAVMCTNLATNGLQAAGQAGFTNCTQRALNELIRFNHFLWAAGNWSPF